MDENRNEAMQQPIEAVPVAPAGNPMAKTALILSIIAAALCEWPVASIAAIVLAALALPRANKAMACANAGGGKKPMAIVAKVLSIVALVLQPSHRERLRDCSFFDDILVLDAANIPQVCASVLQDKYADYFDVVINCVNKPGTELSALSSARQGGTVFFATLGSDYKLAALTAESMGKELSIVPYTGFMRNHAAFTLALLREFPEAQKFLSPYSTYPSFEDHVRA